MLLRDGTGYGVEVRVTGYQFTDAEDPRKRYSWHMVEGHGWAAEGDWPFCFAALTSDETPLVGRWLRRAASESGLKPLRFTEPNLGLALVDRDAANVTVTVELDTDFLPPWRRPERGPIYAGDPFVITLRLRPDALLAAADEWDVETQPFPDRLDDGVGSFSVPEGPL